MGLWKASLQVLPKRRGISSSKICFSIRLLEPRSFVIPSPFTLSQKIKVTFFPMAVASMDHISWASQPNGDFDLKEAYKLVSMDNDSHHHETFTGNWVWKSVTLPKIKCFFWQCLHRSIPVRDVLVVRGLSIPHSCPLCGAPLESLIHTLRDCP